MMKFSFNKKARTGTNWHHDFRIPERLPDIKPIRTKFIINVACVGVALVLLGMAGSREFTKAGIRSEIATFEQERTEKMPQNNKLTQMSQEYNRISQRLNDAIKFKKQPIHPVQLIAELSKQCPPDLIYDGIQFQHVYDGSTKREEYQVRIAGKGKTTSAIGELKNHLSTLPVSSGFVISVNEQGNPTKDAQTGFFSFQIAVIITAAPNAKK
jgi:hypothetical protein